VLEGRNGYPPGSSVVAMKRRIGAAVVAGAALLASCGTSSKSVAAPALLVTARTTINATHALHFTVTSNRLPNAGTTLTSGDGDLARPGQLRGMFQISVDGLPTRVSIIETAGVFFVKLPFTSKYQITQPAKFGFSDPAQLIDPNQGVSRLLTEIAGAKVTGHTRVNGEVLETISGTVPGDAVTEFLPDVAPSRPVQLVLAINASNSQVRQVEVTGPFAVATVQSTYTVTLTSYGEAVTITAPST
jgi:lipoprotein LprG